MKEALEKLLVPIDGADFEVVGKYTADSTMIILGETHHCVDTVKTEFELAMYLNSHCNTKVLALETEFSHHLRFEAMTLGYMNQLPRDTPEFIGEVIRHNSQRCGNDRLQVTSIDIEHSLWRDTSSLKEYFKRIASFSNTRNGRDRLLEASTILRGCNSPEKLRLCLDSIEECWGELRGTYSPDIDEEMRFALEILRTSITYHSHCGARSADSEKIRTHFFRETVQRALRSAANRDGNLLCCMGATHACLNPDERNGTALEGLLPEGYFFANQNLSTKSKTFVIRILALGMNDKELVGRQQGEIEAQCRQMPFSHERAYLDLHKLDGTAWSVSNPQLFSPQFGPKYDGLLLIWK